VLDDGLYITTTKNRAKAREMEADPRVSVVREAGPKGAIPVVGRIELFDDRDLVARFLEKLADNSGSTGAVSEHFIKRTNSTSRVVGKITPQRLNTFDPRKLT